MSAIRQPATPVQTRRVASGNWAKVGAAPAWWSLEDQPARAKQRGVIVVLLLAAALIGLTASSFSIGPLIVVLVVAVVIMRPVIRLPLLLLSAAVVPYELGTGTESAINVVMLLVGALTVLHLLELLVAGHALIPPGMPAKPWGALVAIALVSILAGAASWNPLVTVKSNFIWVQLAQWSIYVLSAATFWLAASTIRDRRQLMQLSGLLVALGGVWIGVNVLWAAGMSRLPILLDAAVFRIWTVALTGAAACFWPQLGRRRRILSGTYAVVNVALPLVTAPGWSAGWLPGLIVLATLGVMATWRYVRVAALFSVIAALPVISLWIPRLYRSERWSFDTRVIAWRGIVDLLDGHWLTGLGLASYWHYWRSIIGVIQYRDPGKGYTHYSFDPKVNTHNNFVDVLAQMGLLGIIAFAWLLLSLAVLAVRVARREPAGFGKAYATGSLAALAGMIVAAMLGDWLFPFVYNIGLRGFRDSFLGWMFLGGLSALSRTSPEALGYADAR